MRTVSLSVFSILTLATLLFAGTALQAQTLTADPAPAARSVSLGLPEGCRPATAEEKEIVGESMVCPGDTPTLFGGCSEDPYSYLEQRHAGDKSNSFITPRQTSGDSARLGLDPALACRLKKLLEFSESNGCRLSITSAMRPTQRCNPSGGACARQGNSCHQFGLAVDISGTPQCLRWVTEIVGRDNPNSPFGVHVAYVENSPTYRHLQCVEHLGANRTIAGGCYGPCQGSFEINPDTSIPPPTTRTPTREIADRFRELFGGEEQCTLSDGTQVRCSAIVNRNNPQTTGSSPSGGSAPSGGSSAPGSSQISDSFASNTCSPEFFCSGNSLFYRTSTCQEQPYKSCPQGCSNASCIGGSNERDPISEALAGVRSTSTSTSTPDSELSVFERINLIASPDEADEDSSSPGVTLEEFLSGNYAARLEGENSPDLPLETNAPEITGSGGISPVPPGAQQTFTSLDLRDNWSAQTQPFGATPTTLESLKEMLLDILAYLRPFGRPHVHALE